ncbi:nucleoside hydrolase [Paenibacillus montanisoli]|nr:nucleoside hydrolase [Paenibacillus montanisoli]
MAKIPCLIDCDTGMDDAIALICALLSQDRLDLKAITTVAGCVEVDKTSRNTLNIVDSLGSQIPVIRGAEAPLQRELYVAISHGTSGLGDVVVPEAKRALQEMDAVDMIYRCAVECEGKLQLLVTGPLTNVAKALTRYPAITSLIEKITIMGGALRGGNMTQASEFNIWVDPEAADIVFRSGISLTMVGLDVTLKTELPQYVYEQVRAMDNPFASLAADVFSYMMRRNSLTGVSLYGSVELDPAHMHDVLAMAVVVRPDLIKTEPHYIEVELAGSCTRGMTVADFNDVMNKQPNVDAAVDVDLDAFWAWMLELLEHGPKRIAGRI